MARGAASARMASGDGRVPPWITYVIKMCELRAIVVLVVEHCEVPVLTFVWLKCECTGRLRCPVSIGISLFPHFSNANFVRSKQYSAINSITRLLDSSIWFLVNTGQSFIIIKPVVPDRSERKFGPSHFIVSLSAVRDKNPNESSSNGILRRISIHWAVRWWAVRYAHATLGHFKLAILNLVIWSLCMLIRPQIICWMLNRQIFAFKHQFQRVKRCYRNPSGQTFDSSRPKTSWFVVGRLAYFLNGMNQANFILNNWSIDKSIARGRGQVPFPPDRQSSLACCSSYSFIYIPRVGFRLIASHLRAIEL